MTAGPLRRSVGWVLAALLGVGWLTACSGQQDEYCAALEGAQKDLADLAADADVGKGEQPGDTLTPTLDVLRDVRAKAPDDLKDEWDTVVFAYEDLADAAEQAGIDPADLVSGRTPEGLSPQEARHVGAVAAKLESPRVVDAATGIEDHAREVCDVEFDT